MSGIQEIGLPLLLSFTLASVHFLGEELEGLVSGYREEILSFSTGVSVSYIFTRLVPEFHRAVAGSSELVFLAPLAGFSSIHLAEKVIAKKGYSGAVAKKEYSEIHSAFLFLYHGAIGFLLVSLIGKNLVSGVLFFLPILLHSAVSSLSFTELHEVLAERLGVKLAVSASPLIGVLVHGSGLAPEKVFNPVFGLVTGMFVYVVIRDSIPEGDSGKPRLYILGASIYLAVILGASAVF